MKRRKWLIALALAYAGFHAAFGFFKVNKYGVTYGVQMPWTDWPGQPCLGVNVGEYGITACQRIKAISPGVRVYQFRQVVRFK